MKRLVFLLLSLIIIICLFACSASFDNKDVPYQEKTGDVNFSSAEEAYYHKYTELAEKHGTHTLYDVRRGYYGRSYLNGVCVVNLMDFNGDGIQDLFVVYSNGQMNNIKSDGLSLEVCDFPTKNTYEIEIWTYNDGELTQLLHEPFVSLCYIYPNQNFNGFYARCYRIFINVYENTSGSPVVQLYDESDEGSGYVNIYYSSGKITRDAFLHDGSTFQMNGFEIAENTWDENVAGYNKILLSVFLADSNSTSNSLLDGYGIDYNCILSQTEQVIRHLSQVDITPKLSSFNIAEGEYIPLYLKEILRSNRSPCFEDSECIFKEHYYALYDIDKNGVPELILYEGSTGAKTHYHFYTIVNGEVIDCGFYGRTNLFVDGDGGLIAYYGRMGGYQIEKITLEATTIKTTFIAGNHWKSNADKYPELDEIGYINYKGLVFCPPTILSAFYTFNQSEAGDIQ
ncbi:MAG: hypothetical protein M0R40_08220 [Firmicutes bacterium]|nr:hypothetical protein [Bacillota bacterium]